MNALRAGYAITLAFVAFAAWEVLSHGWLGRRGGGISLGLSLTVELGLVFLIAAVALSLVRHQAKDHRSLCLLEDAVFVSLAQHLRPRLASLLTALAALEREPSVGLSQESRQLLHQAARDSEAILAITDDLATAVGALPGAQHMTAGQVVERALDSFRPLAGQRAVMLTADTATAAALPCRFTAAVLQVLTDLVDNAVRASAAGGEVRVSVGPAAEGEALVFRVADAAPLLLERRAAWAEAAGGRESLHQAQTTVEALGGSAWYEPTPQGNSFAFSLAISDARA